VIDSQPLLFGDSKVTKIPFERETKRNHPVITS
jgi:hypothetical protein